MDRADGGGCGYEFCWGCGSAYPCRGGCTPVAAVAWNASSSTLSDDNTTRRHSSVGITAKKQLSEIWKDTFHRANICERQVEDMKAIIDVVDTCRSRKPHMSRLLKSLKRALRCGIELAQLVKNVCIRCYFLHEAAQTKQAGCVAQRHLGTLNRFPCCGCSVKAETFCCGIYSCAWICITRTDSTAKAIF